MVSTVPAKGHQLKGISPRAFQHPADRAATAALGSIPYLDTVVRKLIELGYERALRQSYLGLLRAARPRSSSATSGASTRSPTRRSTWPTCPTCTSPSIPRPNAMAIGARRPIVVVQSELVRLLDAPQRRAVFAHEAAHILSDHQLYRTALYDPRAARPAARGCRCRSLPCAPR